MPDSIYLIVTSSNTATASGSLPPTRLSTYLVEVQDGEDEQTAVDRFARASAADLLGCNLDVYDPAAARRYRLNPGVEAVEAGS